MDLILEHLAVGNAGEGAAPPGDVTALLCVAQEVDLPSVAVSRRHKIPVVDMQPIPDGQLREAVQWITDTIEGERILVFCNAGVGRSPSVVVGYLCCRLGYGFGQAVERVARRHPYMSILPDLIRTVDRVCAGRR